MPRVVRRPAVVALAAFAGACGDLARAPCGGDTDCDPDEVCWTDGRCLPRNLARQLGGLGDECGPDLYCQLGRCWAGRCVVTYDPGPGPDAGPDAPLPDLGVDAWVSPCGNGTCEAEYLEDCVSCEADCLACCGNGACEPRYAEYCATCEEDCGGCCGDGFCDPEGGEGCDSCVADCLVCLVTCGDGTCDVAGGENCGRCALDCPCCGEAAVGPPGLDYATQIQPIFDGECITCHTADGGFGGLILANFEGVAAGGDSGPAVNRCSCEDSILYLKTGPDPPFLSRMPPSPPYLTDAQRQAICDWLDQGADETYDPWACGGPPECDFCGDLTCAPAAGETCATCPADCGAC